MSLFDRIVALEEKIGLTGQLYLECAQSRCLISTPTRCSGYVRALGGLACSKHPGK